VVDLLVEVLPVVMVDPVAVKDMAAAGAMETHQQQAQVKVTMGAVLGQMAVAVAAVVQVLLVLMQAALQVWQVVLAAHQLLLELVFIMQVEAVEDRMLMILQA
jgi:hypothetical protein